MMPLSRFRPPLPVAHHYSGVVAQRPHTVSLAVLLGIAASGAPPPPPSSIIIGCCLTQFNHRSSSPLLLRCQSAAYRPSGGVPRWGPNTNQDRRTTDRRSSSGDGDGGDQGGHPPPEGGGGGDGDAASSGAPRGRSGDGDDPSDDFRTVLEGDTNGGSARNNTGSSTGGGSTRRERAVRRIRRFLRLLAAEEKESAAMLRAAAATRRRQQQKQQQQQQQQTTTEQQEGSCHPDEETRSPFHTLIAPDAVPQNPALEAAMAFMVATRRDPRAALDFTQKLVGSTLLSLASPVGYWDPYDVKPQSFALDHYAALPVFTSLVYLQHFCHRFGFVVRDPSGNLWADGADAQRAAPILVPPALSEEAEAAVWAATEEEQQHQQHGASGGERGVKNEAIDNMRTNQFWSSGSGRAGEAEEVIVGPITKATFDERRAAILSHAAVVDANNAAIDADVLGDLMMMDDEDVIVATAANASTTATAPDEVMSGGTTTTPGNITEATAEGTTTNTASTATATSGEASSTTDLNDTKNTHDNHDDSGKSKSCTKRQRRLKHIASYMKRRSLMMAGPPTSNGASTSMSEDDASQQHQQQQQQQQAERAQAAAAARAEKALWDAVTATRTFGIKTAAPLQSHGPFIRPYLVGYYADIKTLLHNASILPHVVDVIVNPGSPLETVLDRASTQAIVSDELLVASAYRRVEVALRSELHQFFAALEQAEGHAEAERRGNRQRHRRMEMNRSRQYGAHDGQEVEERDRLVVYSARSTCLPHAAAAGTPDARRLFDIVVLVDTNDFEGLLQHLRQAKHSGRLRGHVSLSIVPFAAAEGFLQEGSTVFYTSATTTATSSLASNESSSSSSWTEPRHEHSSSSFSTSTSKTFGVFQKVGSHATISLRYDADSIYADPTNQTTEAHGIAAQRYRLKQGGMDLI